MKEFKLYLVLGNKKSLKGLQWGLASESWLGIIFVFYCCPNKVLQTRRHSSSSESRLAHLVSCSDSRASGCPPLDSNRRPKNPLLRLLAGTSSLWLWVGPSPMSSLLSAGATLGSGGLTRCQTRAPASRASRDSALWLPPLPASLASGLRILCS